MTDPSADGPSEDVIRDQIRDIFISARRLSRFMLGREVEVVFDPREHAPLGYVPITPRVSRRIHLSARLLLEQPENVVELHRAIIIHELGHLLLHLKESSRSYAEVERIMRKKITADPVFFDLFNVLLDEQLERVLRDARPDWRRWFHKLQFYARRLPLTGLESKAARARRASAKEERELEIAQLAHDGLIAIYERGPRRTYQALSAAVLTDEYGFARPFAFYYVLRFGLPRATVREEWLADCLSYIPGDFNTLDLMGMHRLAYKIYARMFEHSPTVALRVRLRGKGELVEVPVPGRWRRPEVAAEVHVVRSREESKRRVSAARSAAVTMAPPASEALPQDDSEGEPPPPPPPPPAPLPVQSIPNIAAQPASPRSFAGRPGSGTPVPAPTLRPLPASSRSWISASPPELEAKPTKRPTRPRIGHRKKEAKPLTPREELQRKLRTRQLPEREKRRLRAEIEQLEAARSEAERAAHRAEVERFEREAEATRREKAELEQRQREAARRAADAAQARQEAMRNLHPARPSLPQPPAPERVKLPPAPPARRETVATEAARAEAARLNVLLGEIEKELAAGTSRAIPGAHPTAELLRGSDFRNTGPGVAFPALESIRPAVRIPRAEEALAAGVRRWVPTLRSHLARLEPDRRLEERLQAGSWVAASELRKLVCYGETRVFRGLRTDELELFRELHVSVLIDTSASMAKGGRLERAKAAAALLAGALRDCSEIESAFFGFNQHLYVCGTHMEPSFAALEARGKTNEAAALDRVHRLFGRSPRSRRLVIVLTDGLPTRCTVESVRHVVADMERGRVFRFLLGALAPVDHPAYRRRLDLTGPLDGRAVAALGRHLLEMIK